MKLNYSDKSLRKAYEKKWDVLQELHTRYVTTGEQNSFDIPLSTLLIKNREQSLILGILKSLEKEDCFTFDFVQGVVAISKFKKVKFYKTYKLIQSEYKKFAEFYQKAHTPSTTLDFTNTTPSYNKLTHEIKFLGVLIPIPPNSNQEILCQKLFIIKRNLRIKWTTYDLAQELLHADFDDTQTRKKIYSAAVNINKTVEKYTKIKKLIITGTKEIRVNPQYCQ